MVHYERMRSNFLPKLLIRCHRQFIAAFVFWMAAVGGDVMKVHRVQFDQLIQPFPQVVILNRLEAPFFPPPPAVLFPARHPGLQALADIFAVGV